MLRSYHTLAMLVLAALLTVACGDEDGEPTPGLGSPTATPTTGAVEPTLTPGGTGPAEAFAEALAAAEGPIAVYTRITSRGVSPGGARTSAVEVVTYDTGTGTELAAFRLPEIEHHLLDFALTPDGDVIVNEREAVVRYHPWGERAATLHEAPGDGLILGFALSHDGTILAVSECTEERVTNAECEGYFGRSRLVAVDAGSGNEIFHSDRDLVTGQPAIQLLVPEIWRDDGAAFVATGRGQGDGVWGVASIYLDGRVIEHPTNGWYAASPDGRLLVDGMYALGPCCQPRPATIYDLDTGEPIAGYTDPELGLVPEALWSPDGSEVLMLGFAGDPDAPTEGWLLLSLDGSAERVPDPLAVWRRWYGERTITQVCEGRELPAQFVAPSSYLTPCDDPEAQAIFGVGPATAPTVSDRFLAVIGFLE